MMVSTTVPAVGRNKSRWVMVWTFKKKLSGGEGIVYAIKDDGELLWYKHGGYADGGGSQT